MNVCAIAMLSVVCREKCLRRLCSPVNDGCPEGLLNRHGMGEIDIDVLSEGCTPMDHFCDILTGKNPHSLVNGISLRFVPSEAHKGKLCAPTKTRLNVCYPNC